MRKQFPAKERIMNVTCIDVVSLMDTCEVTELSSKEIILFLGFNTELVQRRSKEVEA